MRGGLTAEELPEARELLAEAAKPPLLSPAGKRLEQAAAGTVDAAEVVKLTHERLAQECAINTKAYRHYKRGELITALTQRVRVVWVCRPGHVGRHALLALLFHG